MENSNSYIMLVNVLENNFSKILRLKFSILDANQEFNNVTAFRNVSGKAGISYRHMF